MDNKIIFELEYDTTQDDAVWIMLKAVNELLTESNFEIEMNYDEGRDGWQHYQLKITDRVS